MRTRTRRATLIEMVFPSLVHLTEFPCMARGVCGQLKSALDFDVLFRRTRDPIHDITAFFDTRSDATAAFAPPDERAGDLAKW